MPNIMRQNGPTVKNMINMIKPFRPIHIRLVVRSRLSAGVSARQSPWTIAAGYCVMPADDGEGPAG